MSTSNKPAARPPSFLNGPRLNPPLRKPDTLGKHISESQPLKPVKVGRGGSCCFFYRAAEDNAGNNAGDIVGGSSCAVCSEEATQEKSSSLAASTHYIFLQAL